MSAMGSADISQRLPDLPAKAAARLFLVALPNQNADHSTRKRIRIAECSLILSEAKAPQPTSKVHGGALTPPGAHDPPGETTRPGHCFRMTAVGSKPVKLRTRMFFGFPQSGPPTRALMSTALTERGTKDEEHHVNRQAVVFC